MEQISLSRFTVARRIDDLSENIKVSQKDRISKCSALSIALDESTDLSDTALRAAENVLMSHVFVNLDLDHCSQTGIGGLLEAHQQFVHKDAL